MCVDAVEDLGRDRGPTDMVEPLEQPHSQAGAARYAAATNPLCPPPTTIASKSRVELAEAIG
ncbi:hypothetical protein I552_1837 [Mycobacterium xenopi 3993]|nr:hypothetical protein I552_1837 [Mycobacterium xenopi 3993]